MNDKVKDLYDFLTNEGYDFMGSEDDFRGKLKDGAKAGELYSFLTNEGYDFMGTYDEFISKVGAPYNTAAANRAAGLGEASVKARTAQQPRKTRYDVAQEQYEQGRKQTDATPISQTAMGSVGGYGISPTGMPVRNTQGYPQANPQPQAPAKPMAPAPRAGQWSGAPTTQVPYAPTEEEGNKSFMPIEQGEDTKARYDAQRNAVGGQGGQVETMRSDIDSRLQEAYQRDLDNYGSELDKGGFWARMGRSVQAAEGNNPAANAVPSQLSDDTRDYQAAKHALDNSQKIIDEANAASRNGNFFAGAGRGMRDKFFDVSTWDFGITDLTDQVAIMRALDAYDKGGEEALSDSQRKLLDAKAVELATTAYFGSELGRGYKAGQVTAEAIPFMFEMAINPAAGVGKGASKAMVRYALKKFGKEAIEKGGKRYIAKQAMKYGTRIVGDVIGASGMTATTGAARTAADALDRMAGNLHYDTDEQGNITFDGHTDAESWVKAFGKAFASTTIENYSEMLGNYFGPALGLLGKGASKVGKGIARTKAGAAVGRGIDKIGGVFENAYNSTLSKKIGLQAVGDFISKVPAGKVAGFLSELEKRAQWHGVMGEYAEEVAGGILNALVVGDQTLDTDKDTGVFNLDNNIDTFLGVALMGGFFSGAKTVGYGVERANNARQFNKANRMGASAFGDGWADVQAAIESDPKAGAVAVLIDPNTTKEQREAALRYAAAVTARQGMEQGKAKRDAEGVQTPQEAAAEQSYNMGYDDANTDELRSDINMAYTDARAKLVGLIGEDAVNDIDSDPLAMQAQYDQDMTVDDNTKSAIADYVSAKSAWDGVQQRINDDAADRADQRRAEGERMAYKGKGDMQGAIRPLTINEDSSERDPETGERIKKTVYLVNGTIAIEPNGNGLSREGTDKTIYVYDPETGDTHELDPFGGAGVLSVGDVVSMEDYLANNEQQSQAEVQQAAETAQGKVKVNTPFETPQGRKGVVQSIEGDNAIVLFADGEMEQASMPLAEVQQYADALRRKEYEARHPQQTPAEQPQQPNTATEGQAPTAGQTAPQEGNNATAEQPQVEYPRDKQGNIDYDKIGDATTFATALGEEFGEDAPATLDDIIAEETAKMEKQNAVGKARIRKRLAMLEEAKAQLTQTEEAPAEAPTAEVEQPAQQTEEIEQPTAQTEVPDMSVDKASDARARGYRMQSGVRYDRQGATEGVMGSETEVKFTNKEKPVKGRWKVVEAGSVQPSHIGGQNNPLHFITEAQPKDRTDKVSDAESDKIAANINPKEIIDGVTAYTGAPVVNSRGEVIQGNNRATALRKMGGYAESAARYKQYLIDHAADYGLNAEDIAKMQNPVMVREVDVTDEEAIRLGQFTASDTESGGKERISADKVLGKLTDEQTASVLNIMLRGGEETDETLMQLIDRNGADVLTYLAGQGAINDTQVQSAYGRDGRMTPEAKNDLADMVTQNIFKGGADNIKKVWNEYLPVAAQKALLQAMAGDLRLPKKARLIEYVRNAIMAVGEIKNNPFTKDAKTAEEYHKGLDMDARQADMLSRPIKERYSELELYIAVDILLTKKQNAIKAIFGDYQRLFLEKGADLFEAPKEYTPEEAIEKVFGIKLNKIDNNEQGTDTGGSHETGTSETGETAGNGELGRGERQTEGEPGADTGAAEQAAVSKYEEAESAFFGFLEWTNWEYGTNYDWNSLTSFLKWANKKAKAKNQPLRKFVREWIGDKYPPKDAAELTDKIFTALKEREEEKKAETEQPAVNTEQTPSPTEQTEGTQKTDEEWENEFQTATTLEEMGKVVIERYGFGNGWAPMPRHWRDKMVRQSVFEEGDNDTVEDLERKISNEENSLRRAVEARDNYKRQDKKREAEEDVRDREIRLKTYRDLLSRISQGQSEGTAEGETEVGELPLEQINAMSDEELLSWMEKDGNGDLNKAMVNMDVYDVYDSRHNDEYLQHLDNTNQEIATIASQLENGNTANNDILIQRIADIYTDAEEEYNNGGSYSEKRTELLARMEAADAWLEENVRGEGEKPTATEETPKQEPKLTDKEQATLDKFNTLTKRAGEIKAEVGQLIGEPTQENYDKATDEVKAKVDALLGEYRTLTNDLPKDDLLALKQKVWAMLGSAQEQYRANESKENGNQLNRWANLDTDINKALRDHYGDKNLYMGDMVVPFKEEQSGKAVSAVLESTEKIEDFGEKIGMARKDTATKGIKRGVGEMPAWKKKYRRENVTPEELQALQSGKLSFSQLLSSPAHMVQTAFDPTKPFVGFYVEEPKTRWGSIRYYPIKDAERNIVAFNSEAEYEAALPVFEVRDQGYRVVEKDGKYKIVRRASNGKQVEYAEFDTREDAEAYMVTPEGATSLLNRKRENFELPALESLTRNGMKDWRKGRNITSDDMLQTFGFRGGEFGNWLNAEERQQFLNTAYDALMDLAEALGVSPRALSLGGALSIAFGARGRQGARAHYEPSRAVINLTKMKGAGSLAHEWAHALDNYFGMLKAGKEREHGGENDKWVTSQEWARNSQIRKEIDAIFSEIVQAMKHKTVTRQIDIDKAQADVDKKRASFEREVKAARANYERGVTKYVYNRKTKQREQQTIKPTEQQLAEFDRIMSEVTQNPQWEWDEKKQGFRLGGELGKQFYELVHDVMPNTKGAYGPAHNAFYFADKLAKAEAYLEKAKQGESETVRIKTDFLEGAEEGDKGRAGSYYTKDLEMFARAFETYLAYKMAASGRSSDYLTYKKGEVFKSLFGFTPYPEGEELSALTTLFDKLFSTMQEYTDEQGNVMLYERADGKAARVSAKERKLRDAIVDLLRNKAGIDVVTESEEGQRVLDMANGRERQHRVYHGSGADFEAFDHTHMGEGEGAQAFGWGTYVTEVEGIGRQYAENLPKVWFRDTESGYEVDWEEVRDNWEEGVKRSALLRVFENARGADYNMEKAIENAISEIEGREGYEEELAFLRQLTADNFEIDRILYTVEIPEDNGSNYLEWDKKASDKQTEAIKNALMQNEAFRTNLKNEYDSRNEWTDKPPFEEWLENVASVTSMYGKENGKRLYNELSNMMGSEQAVSEFLHSAGFVGVKYPAEYYSGGRSDGAKNYVIFNESDLQITDKVKFFRTESGEAYGFTMGGKIYLDPRIATAETPIHEYTHLWAAALRAANPKAWERLKSELEKDKDLMAYVQRLYPELKGDELMDEVFAHFSGRRGAERLRAEQERMEGETRSIVGKAKVIAMFENLREALKKFWNAARELFAGKGVKNESAEDFADMVLADLVGGYKPDRVDRVDRNDRERDAEYMEAVNSGDMEKAQRMVNEAAKRAMPDTKVVDENGNPLVVYHGVKGKIIVFDKNRIGENLDYGTMGAGFYFTSDRENAENYARNAKGEGEPSVERVFINIRNIKEVNWNELDGESKKKSEAFTAKAIAKGYDGLTAYAPNRAWWYVAFGPSQIKSADPVTYDNNGNVIPLSERFNSGNADIRYEKVGGDEIAQRDKEYAEAVAAGDKEKIDAMLREEMRRKGYADNSDYQGSLAFNGAAPSSNAYFETREERKEAFDNGELEDDFSLGDFMEAGIDTHDLEWQLANPIAASARDKATLESINNLRSAVRGKKKTIKMYRAVPADLKEGSFRNGDWVTPSRKYAEQHIELQDWEGGRIIEQEVSVDDIWWNGDDINEWGFDDGKGYAYKNTENNRKLMEPTYDDNGNLIPLSERFTDTDSDVRFRGEEEPVFYSNAMRAVENIKQERATPEQWVKMIEKQGGLKAGEDKWLGLSEWLKGSNAKTLTKGEVLDYIRANEIQIEEVEYSEDAVNPNRYFIDLANGDNEWTSLMESEVNKRYGWDSEDAWVVDYMPYEWFRFNVDNADEKLHLALKTNAKAKLVDESSYDLDDEEERELFISDIETELMHDMDSWSMEEDESENLINSTRLQYTTEGLDNKREIVLTVPTIEPWNEHDEIHFGEAGGGRAVAWVRFGETTDADGKRVLVIDEIQSKRHQEGREKGYRTKDDVAEEERLQDEVVKAQERYDDFTRKMAEKYDGTYEDIYADMTEAERQEADRLEQAVYAADNAYQNHALKDIPDAPFDKNWHEVAMKRMLRFAAENGYDKVAWTTGEQQAERYDLGGLIDHIDIYPHVDNVTGERVEGEYEVFPVDKRGNTMMEMTEHPFSGNLTADEVLQYYGKDLGTRMMQAADKAGKDEKSTIDGDGLRIGGEGMKGFYDQILPRFMDKYGKRWGVKTGEVELPNIGDNGLTMWSVDVTDDMRESVMRGQPLFRNLEESDNVVNNADAGTRPLTDREKIAKLESGPKVKVYRSMQLIDGKLYPPMSARVDGQLREPSEIGVWEEAEEHPELADENGKFKLDKGNKKSLKAAYNPYIHTSRTMLNDQFSEAQSRPNLVVVEVEIPESELNGTYRAEKAKDSVGAKQWKAGVIQGQLSGTREVILSRWAKPVRIVPDAEVAENIARQIEGQVSVMPSNVVTPQVRAELEKRGVRFVETDNTGRLTSGSRKGETWAQVYGKNATKQREGGEEAFAGEWYDRNSVERIGEFAGYTPKQIAAMNARHEESARKQFRDAAEKLHLSDNITFADSIDDVPGLTDKQRKEWRRKKGWYSPRTGKIVIILGNHKSMDDVMKSILHEGVAHHGLRQMFGRHFDMFLTNVYETASPEIRERIDEMAKRHGWDFREATEEYLAMLAEDTDFERPENQSWWKQVKAWFFDMLHKIGFKLHNMYDTITDNELRYVLWRSYQNLVNPGRFNSVVEEAKDIAKQYDLKVGQWDETWTTETPEGPNATMEFNGRRVPIWATNGRRGNRADRSVIKPSINLNEIAEIKAEAENDGFVAGIGIDMTMTDGNVYHLWVGADKEEEDYETTEFYPQDYDDDIPNEEMTERFGKFFGENVNKIFGSIIGGYIMTSGRRGFTLSHDEIMRMGGVRNNRMGSDYNVAADGVAEDAAEYAKETERIEQEARANGTWMKAPNGKRSNLTEKQWVMVRTKAFKRWFGDWQNDPDNASRVVDENGEPLVVYHGTPYSFTEFEDEGDKGIFFSSIDRASWYVKGDDYPQIRKIIKPFESWDDVKAFAEKNDIEFEKADEEEYDDAYILHGEYVFSLEEALDKAQEYFDNIYGDGGIIPVFLNIRKPRHIDAKGKYAINVNQSRNRKSQDGVIVENVNDPTFDEGSDFEDTNYIVYSPNQIKSATSNNGNYDPSSDDIRFRDGEDEESDSEERESIEQLANNMSIGTSARFAAIAARNAQESHDNAEALAAALNFTSQNLAEIVKATKAQKKFDKATVKQVTDMARVMVSAGYLDSMGRADVKGLLKAIRESTGETDNTDNVNRIIDIMVKNQLKNQENTLATLLKIKGSRVDARGINVQGKLDPNGQQVIKSFKDNMKEQRETIESRIADAEERMTSEDKAIADAAYNEKVGLQLALDYVEKIGQSKADEKDIEAKKRAELSKVYDYTRVVDVDEQGNALFKKDGTERTHEVRHVRAEYKGKISDEKKAERERVEQTAAAMDDAIRHMRMERIDAYTDFIAQVAGNMKESMRKLEERREAEKRRIEEIHHNANSDMEGRPASEHRSDTGGVLNWINNTAGGTLFAPLASFGEMLRMFGRKSPNGEGYLFNRFMRGLIDARHKELNGVHDKYSELDKKAQAVFGGKVETWADMMNAVRKGENIIVEWFDGKEMKPHTLHQGNLMYIYMVNKMSDGRMKLRHMGIDDKAMAVIESKLDPRLKEIADWLQEDFLVRSRNEYNETHKRMFGASMSAIEDYFPLVINSGSRNKDAEKEDAAENNPNTITTATGAIKKRTVNVVDLDLLNADALHVVLDHIAEMEHWNAFAEYNRDLNTLRSYKRFENQVKNMTTILGDGEQTWKAFNKTAQIAVGSYQKAQSDLDAKSLEFASKVTAAKVAFRINTALKQLLSLPAYLPYANASGFYHALANDLGNGTAPWKWCMENLPMYRERWESRVSGDPRLLKLTNDWKSQRATRLQKISRAGMLPNAAVDALTVSIGAHAVYETRKAQYLKEGYSETAAEKRAIQDAEIAYNETQQSSEGGFVSVMQVDKSWLNVLFTIFRNASMAYQRQLHGALRNLINMRTKARREQAKEFLAKQIARDGVNEAQARLAAEQRFNRAMRKNWIAVATFGYIVQFAWNFGGQMWYLLFGDDDDKKKKTWKDILIHSLFGGVEGLTGGDWLSELGRQIATGDRNPQSLNKDMPLTSDMFAIIEKFGQSREWEAVSDIINLAVQAGVGANPQTLTDAVVATIDACNGDLGLAREAGLWAMRVIQVPQSQTEQIYFDEIGMTGEEARKLSYEQLVERYAKYRVKRNYFWTPWEWDNEKALEKGEKRGERIIKERMETMSDEQLEEALSNLFESSGEKGKKLSFNQYAKREGLKGYDYSDATKNDGAKYYMNIATWRDVAEDITLHQETKRLEDEIKRLKKLGVRENEAVYWQTDDRLKDLNEAKKEIGEIKKEMVDANGNPMSEEVINTKMENIRKARRRALYPEQAANPTDNVEE